MVSTLRFAAALRFRTFPFLFSVGYTYDRLTDEERQELTQKARDGAAQEYDYKGEIDALWAAVRALQQSISPPAEDEWPEFVQPTGAGTAYQVGDKVTFKGVRYVCRLPHCVWSPADYPIGWQKQN